jgi:hypothetical protein
MAFRPSPQAEADLLERWAFVATDGEGAPLLLTSQRTL